MVKLYQTIFPLKSSESVSNISGVVADWISNSPHYSISNSRLQSLFSSTGTYSDASLDFDVINYSENKNHYFGLRFSSHNFLETYISDICIRKSEKELLFSYSLEVNSRHLGISQKDVKKPLIVDKLINDIGGDFDGESLIVKKTPTLFKDDALDFVGDILNGRSGNNLPVVYVSKGECQVIDSINIAKKLAGLAHVLVEPSRQFSYKLKKITADQNAYGGAIGIYFPFGRSIRILNSENFEEEIFQKIKTKSLYRSIPSDLTFDGLKLKVLENNARKIVALGKEEVDIALSASIDLEKKIGFLEKQIEVLKDQNNSLESAKIYLENRIETLEAKNDASVISSGIVVPNLPELYAGETVDFIIEALDKSLSSHLDDSRRADYLKKVIEANPISEKGNELYDDLYNILVGATKGLRSADINKIRELGFVIEEEGGKHNKIIYVNGYPSRKYKISSSPSDHRGQKNFASDIRKKML